MTWLPTRQPVVVDLWRHALPPGTRYTTITTWHNEGKDVTYRGQTYSWTKDRAFQKVLDLPRRARVPFELATTVDDAVKRSLTALGWYVRESLSLSSELDQYRSYLQQSRGELTAARDQYTRPNTGWFSDRTACYLAAGRPVITEETGFSRHLPTGRGLFAFRTIEDALAAVAAIEADYPAHCRAAAEIAEEYFAAEKVIGHLMARAGL
jgi:hypothetical protein